MHKVQGGRCGLTGAQHHVLAQCIHDVLDAQLGPLPGRDRRHDVARQDAHRLGIEQHRDEHSAAAGQEVWRGIAQRRAKGEAGFGGHRKMPHRGGVQGRLNQFALIGAAGNGGQQKAHAHVEDAQPGGSQRDTLQDAKARQGVPDQLPEDRGDASRAHPIRPAHPQQGAQDAAAIQWKAGDHVEDRQHQVHLRNAFQAQTGDGRAPPVAQEHCCRAEHRREQNAHGRAGDGYEQLLAGRLRLLVNLCDAAEDEEGDAADADTHAPRHEGMGKLVEQDRSEEE